MIAFLYYLLVFIFIFLGYTRASVEKLNRKGWVQVYVLLIISSVLLGIRYVISDWYTYMIQYEEVLNGNMIMLINEPIWMALEYIFAYFNAPYPVFFSFIYLLILVVLMHGIRYFDRKLLPVAAILVLVTIPNISNIMRQMVAVSIFIYSIRFIIEKKLFQYCIFFVIAFNIHHSIIIFIWIYWLYKLKIKLNPIVQIIIYLSFVLVLSNFVKSAIVKPIEIVQQFGLYERFDSDYENEVSYNTGIGIIINTIINVCLMYYSKIIIRKNEKLSGVYTIFFLCTCLVDAMGTSGGFSTRVFLYGTMLSLILIPSLYYSLKKKYKNPILAYMLIVFVSSSFIFHCFNDFFPGQTPLRFFWEYSEDMIYQYYAQ